MFKHITIPVASLVEAGHQLSLYTMIIDFLFTSLFLACTNITKIAPTSDHYVYTYHIYLNKSRAHINT